MRIIIFVLVILFFIHFNFKKNIYFEYFTNKKSNLFVYASVKNIDKIGIDKINLGDSFNFIIANYFNKKINNKFNIKYVNSSKNIKSDKIILRTAGSKSSKKLALIQNVDKKIPLDEISESRGVEFNVLLSELESIVFSGTKLDIDYYVDDILDEEQQEELHEYFLESESEDISVALKEFDGEYDEEELKIYRIKFLNDVSN